MGASHLEIGSLDRKIILRWLVMRIESHANPFPGKCGGHFDAAGAGSQGHAGRLFKGVTNDFYPWIDPPLRTLVLKRFKRVARRGAVIWLVVNIFRILNCP